MNWLRLAAPKRDELIVTKQHETALTKSFHPFGLAILARKSQVATKRDALITAREL